MKTLNLLEGLFATGNVLSVEEANSIFGGYNYSSTGTIQGIKDEDADSNE